MYLRRFQPLPKTLYNPKLKEIYEELYHKTVAEQRLNNGQLVCFDDKTLAETWVACTVFIDALRHRLQRQGADAHASLRRAYDIVSFYGSSRLPTSCLLTRARADLQAAAASRC
eukprot:4547792-Pleurochrysis_carterae.AAC.1